MGSIGVGLMPGWQQEQECILEFEGNITLDMIYQKFKEKVGDNYVLYAHSYGNSPWVVLDPVNYELLLKESWYGGA